MNDAPGIHQQLGQLIEANNRARDDRLEMRADMGKLFDGLGAIQSQLGALTQSSTSVANQVASLSLQRCGERLTALEKQVFDEQNISAAQRIHDLEKTIRTWEKWMGTGWSFAGRVIVAVIGSGVFWALAAKWADWLSHHV